MKKVTNGSGAIATMCSTVNAHAQEKGDVLAYLLTVKK